MEAQIESLPVHQRPPVRELGRRSEAAPHPFRAMPPDEGEPATPGERETRVPVQGKPLILTERAGSRERIAAACPAAHALGLVIGMPAAQARALVPDLDVQAIDRDADRAWLDRLALHAARHWSPITAPSGADGLWIDLTGTAHLFGGEEAFADKALRFLERLGFTGRIAVADTAGAAWAVARFANDRLTIIRPRQTLAFLAPLPIEALRISNDTVQAARRFGLERIGDLLPLPRAPLARRLGRSAIQRLDQAIGREAEPIAPTLVAEAPYAERRLLEPIGTPEAIEQVIGDLTADLEERLRERGLGARALFLTMVRVDGSEQHLGIGTARATRDGKHLARLMRLKLESVDPGWGIEQARLTATRTEPLDAVPLTCSLSGDDQPPDLAPLVEQLAGRVGEPAVFRTTLSESDVPERAVRRTSPLSDTNGWPTWRRPARLLRRPEPLSNVVALLPDHPPRRFVWRGRSHNVLAGDGPERIHGEWWARDGELWAVRDYFRVEVEGGGQYWLFRRGDGVDASTGDLSWWLHGAG